MATHSSILAWRIPWTEEPVHSITKSRTQLKWPSTQVRCSQRQAVIQQQSNWQKMVKSRGTWGCCGHDQELALGGFSGAQWLVLCSFTDEGPGLILGQGTKWKRQWHPFQYSCWKIPWTEEPGRLQSMGLLWVGHDWAASLSLFTFIHWRKKWQPTPVFLPGEFQGQGAWWAAVYGVTQSQTWLKQLSSSSSRELRSHKPIGSW